MEDLFTFTGEWLSGAWHWNGWPRLADVAAVATAAGTGSIALSLRASRWGHIRAMENYLAQVGKKIAQGEQGLRSEHHLSRHLGIPLEEIGRLGHLSGKLVSRLRLDEGQTEATLRWGHKDYVRGKK